MAKIGYLGAIPFECSSFKQRTFYNFSRSGSAKWEVHEMFGGKPKAEFVGIGQEQISLSMKLSSDMGVNPTDELEKLRKMRDSGEVFSLILGGKTIGDNLWYIESVDETVNFWLKGRIQSADVSLKLLEYVEDKKE